MALQRRARADPLLPITLPAFAAVFNQSSNLPAISCQQFANISLKALHSALGRIDLAARMD